MARRSCFWVMVLMVVLTSARVYAEAQADSPAIREAVRRVLEQEPELVLEVLRRHPLEVYEIVRQGLEAKREQAEADRIADQIDNPLVPVIEENRPALGPATAPVTIVAYSDFICHYCGQAAHTLARLMADHPETIRFYHKHHPLSELSRKAALYFEALGRQDPGRAWQFYDLIFMRQEDIEDRGEVLFDEIARSLGADMARLAIDLDDPVLAEHIRADTAEAERFGFDGTPAVVVNGVGLPGARTLEEYEQIIALTAAKPKP